MEEVALTQSSLQLQRWKIFRVSTPVRFSTFAELRLKNRFLAEFLSFRKDSQTRQVLVIGKFL